MPCGEDNVASRERVNARRLVAHDSLVSPRTSQGTAQGISLVVPSAAIDLQRSCAIGAGAGPGGLLDASDVGRPGRGASVDNRPFNPASPAPASTIFDADAESAGET